MIFASSPSLLHASPGACGVVLLRLKTQDWMSCLPGSLRSARRNACQYSKALARAITPRVGFNVPRRSPSPDTPTSRAALLPQASIGPRSALKPAFLHATRVAIGFHNYHKFPKISLCIASTLVAPVTNDCPTGKGIAITEQL